MEKVYAIAVSFAFFVRNRGICPTKMRKAAIGPKKSEKVVIGNNAQPTFFRFYDKEIEIEFLEHRSGNK